MCATVRASFRSEIGHSASAQPGPVSWRGGCSQRQLIQPRSLLLVGRLPCGLRPGAEDAVQLRICWQRLGLRAGHARSRVQCCRAAGLDEWAPGQRDRAGRQATPADASRRTPCPVARCCFSCLALGSASPAQWLGKTGIRCSLGPPAVARNRQEQTGADRCRQEQTGADRSSPRPGRLGCVAPRTPPHWTVGTHSCTAPLCRLTHAGKPAQCSARHAAHSCPAALVYSPSHLHVARRTVRQPRRQPASVTTVPVLGGLLII